MNDGFRESNESVVTLDWIVEFCEKQSKKYLPNFFDAILDSIEKQPGKCYIYKHIFDDGRMYIGKGVGNRLNTLSRRNAYYQQTLKEVGPPIIEKMCDNISEEAAYKIECALIEVVKDLRT